MIRGRASRRRLPAATAPALLVLGLAAALLALALPALLRERRPRSAAVAVQTGAAGSRPASTDVQPVGRPVRRSRRRVLGSAAVLSVVVGLSAVTVAESAPRPPEPVAALAASPEPAPPPREYAHASLGPAWPQVREVMAETVATARAQGFELQLCVRALDSRAGAQHCEGRRRSLLPDWSIAAGARDIVAALDSDA